MKKYLIKTTKGYYINATNLGTADAKIDFAFDKEDAMRYTYEEAKGIVDRNNNVSERFKRFFRLDYNWVIIEE